MSKARLVFISISPPRMGNLGVIILPLRILTQDNHVPVRPSFSREHRNFAIEFRVAGALKTAAI
jgi:hypothetical protein